MFTVVLTGFVNNWPNMHGVQQSRVTLSIFYICVMTRSHVLYDNCTHLLTHVAKCGVSASSHRRCGVTIIIITIIIINIICDKTRIAYNILLAIIFTSCAKLAVIMWETNDLKIPLRRPLRDRPPIRATENLLRGATSAMVTLQRNYTCEGNPRWPVIKATENLLIGAPSMKAVPQGPI